MPSRHRYLLHMSFQIPGGLSPAAEKALWQRGILTWDDFRFRGQNLLSARRTRHLLQAISAAEKLLESGLWTGYLTSKHPIWLLRLLPLLAPYTVFLDIETTGLRPQDPPVTVAVFHHQQLSLFVDQINLDQLPHFLKQTELVVTYYGQKFDIPRLRRHLKIRPSFHHVDLAPIARAMGLGPGLKAALRQMGWRWPAELPQAGAEIPALWEQFRQGSQDAVQQILLYNAYDAATLPWLWTAMYNLSLKDWPLFRPLPLPKIPDLAAAVQKWCQTYLNC